jgi:glycosyltransferase involved in cell wall biosynthesis
VSLGLSIPMLDEEGQAESVLEEIIGWCDKAGIEVQVAAVNNGSRDGTGEVIARIEERDPRIRAVQLSQNHGYGGGILAGLHLLQECEIIGWMWGDGQIPAEMLPTLYWTCKAGAPMAKVRRGVREDGWRRKTVSRAYAAAMHAMGSATPDVNGCPKLFRAEYLQTLELRSTDWFLDAEAVLKTENRGIGIHSEETVMSARLHGKSKVGWGTIAEFAANMAKWKAKGGL